MHPIAVSEHESPTPARPSARHLGPRGLEGIFGWTFFDPANLVCVTLVGAASILVVLSMRARGAPDWYMPIGLYLCLAVFMRGYFFNYYHARVLGRITVLLVLLLGLLGSAALWADRSLAHEELRITGPILLPASRGFYIAALLHLAASITLFIHILLPRRWLITLTDELADRGGLEASSDRPDD